MKVTRYLLPAVCYLLSLFFTSCEVEFSPNAKWKNVPVVYCVLDQDDDTTWARVQRCYLSEDNIYSYGQNSDSINYPQGSIEVYLLGYENGVLKDSIPFLYTERDRQDGNFAHVAQPLYYSVTRPGGSRRFRDNYQYVLYVRSTADGSLLAYSNPVSLIRQTNATLITKPSVTVTTSNDTIGGFGFYDVDPTTNKRNICHIKWNLLENARLYQPMVRFYYMENGVTRHIDLMGPISKTSEARYSRELFLEEVRRQLQDDTCRKRYIPRVDLFLTCCSEELNVYMSTASQGGGLDQSHEVYNNINGGVGVVASRRTHLYKRMPSDTSLSSDNGLLYYLINLGVGIY
jgi:hypothetical protein